MNYYQWLAALAVLFIALERVWPRIADQRLLRPGWLSDAAYLVFNSKYLGLLLGYVTVLWLGTLDAIFARHWLSSRPWWVQFGALLIAIDFAKWSIHNLLHRVPWLWAFHKVHHSITTMDWIGNWRFHWMEIVVYKSLQWLPLAWLGASPKAVFAVAVVTTVWGDLNHANLDLDLGPLGFVLNGPRMHLWHHDQSAEGGVAKNFGIVLSLWDHLFGTAYWPRERNPERLGYPGVEEMPGTLVGEVLWPLAARGKAAPAPQSKASS